jgi:hypothetical protein
VHLLRSGALVGLTPLMLMVEDLRLALGMLREQPEYAKADCCVTGRGDAGVAALYAALLDETVSSAVVLAPPASHGDGAYLPGILRIFDLPGALGLMAPRPVGVATDHFALGVDLPPRAFERLGCLERFVRAAACDAAGCLRRVLDLPAAPMDDAGQE